jgi:D-cysteine desulfhydrase
MNLLQSLPRVVLGVTPTPLHAAPRLSGALGVEVWFKRDDLCGLGLGGNKVRMLEYLLGDALAQGCDCLVTGAGPQSNWAMLAALAARRCGLDPFLVFYGDSVQPAGNLLLDNLIGANIRFTGDPAKSSVDTGIDVVAGELRQAGRRPCVLPRGGATALGAAGYVRGGLELAGQLIDTGLAANRLWLATGSCGTQAGLVAAARWLRSAHRVVGVSVSRPVPECRRRIAAIAANTAELLGLPTVNGTATVVGTADVEVLDGYLGPGYGLASPEGALAAELVAHTEGVFLDPVFGAKAMAALLDAARSGELDGPVIFLVTGGAPTLFAMGNL